MYNTNDGKNTLQIFDRFEIDYNLPKHSARNESFGDIRINFQDGNNISGVFNNPSDSIIRSIDIEKISFEKIKFWKFFKKKKKIVSLVPLKEFFTKIPFKNMEATDALDYYEKTLLHVKQTGQIALTDKLMRKINVIKAETTLIEHGLTRYLSSEQIIELYDKIEKDKKLKLTWIKNFVKLIPTNALEIKSKVDELKIFDNYVILHFDPNNDATALTEVEDAIKKDPILFGVVKDSDKLYYLADWIDEYCDLTLEKVIETLKEDAMVINNASVKTYIDSK